MKPFLMMGLLAMCAVLPGCATLQAALTAPAAPAPSSWTTQAQIVNAVWPLAKVELQTYLLPKLSAPNQIIASKLLTDIDALVPQLANGSAPTNLDAIAKDVHLLVVSVQPGTVGTADLQHIEAFDAAIQSLDALAKISFTPPAPAAGANPA